MEGFEWENGFWYGDKDGGNTYEGEITDLTLVGNRLEFKYKYRVGGGDAGHFVGDIKGDQIEAADWNEGKGAGKRIGKTDMKEGGAERKITQVHRPLQADISQNDRPARQRQVRRSSSTSKPPPVRPDFHASLSYRESERRQRAAGDALR